ncbi:hypothetical protein Hanom_Chr00s044607g01776061 [Helianthus anomalus]
MGDCSRTPRLQDPRRLSMLHKSRFKGYTYLSCNAQLLNVKMIFPNFGLKINIIK